MNNDKSDNAHSKWDERYKNEEFVLGTNPSPFLETNMEFIKSLTPGSKAFDIACGEGRNSIFLAKQGFTVTGVDISETGLLKAGKWMEREHLKIDFRIANLEEYGFTETYDLIINFNFLLRDLIPKAVAALNPKGVLVIDTLLNSPFVPTTHKKEFLLRPDELYSMLSGFPGTIFCHEERLHDQVPTAKLIFQKSP
jgi:2-polyprenyl-3-methyl-5-hydroxy-6-metoxy-1,4-benzoquinol methylase